MRHKSNNKTRPLFTLSLEMTRLVNETRLLLVPCFNSDIYSTYIHANANANLPLGSHAHLAEPGCLCTKQALGACASKLLENGLGTRRRTSYLLTASGVGT